MRLEELDTMSTEQTEAEQRVGQQIRSEHPYAYRSGQWARIVAVVPARGRKAWLLEWPDGATDTWAVLDPAAEYEFKVR